MANILIIDRSPEKMSERARVGRAIGHTVEIMADHEAARRWVQRHAPDAIVIGGLADDVFRNDLCGQLRQLVPAGQSAIIALVPVSSQLTRIRCLEEGADGVVDPDIAPGPLWSRISGLIPARKNLPAHERLSYAMIEMDVAGHKVAAAGIPLELNLTSFSILRLFLENPERILTRQDISSALGRAGLHRERTIDVHIRTLRLAMKPGGAAELIVTVPQSGYMLCYRAARDCRSIVPTAGNRAVAR